LCDVTNIRKEEKRKYRTAGQKLVNSASILPALPQMGHQ
jgi:hypothetical protein